ncbi:MAG: DUF6172 family protein [Polaromonas sp.]|nr:DUF6172 family protein [Polaromonas sp.]
MRKTYILNVEGKHRDRLVEAAKHDLRRYVKRERNRPLPTAVDFWDFECRFGADEAAAAQLHFGNLTERIDALVSEGGAQFYVELLARPGRRSAKPAASV